jgi:hypothetical protein
VGGAVVGVDYCVGFGGVVRFNISRDCAGRWRLRARRAFSCTCGGAGLLRGPLLRVAISHPS